jgi:hypothetical protein
VQCPTIVKGSASHDARTKSKVGTEQRQCIGRRRNLSRGRPLKDLVCITFIDRRSIVDVVCCDTEYRSRESTALSDGPNRRNEFLRRYSCFICSRGNCPGLVEPRPLGRRRIHLSAPWLAFLRLSSMCASCRSVVLRVAIVRAPHGSTLSAGREYIKCHIRGAAVAVIPKERDVLRQYQRIGLRTFVHQEPVAA